MSDTMNDETTSETTALEPSPSEMSTTIQRPPISIPRRMCLSTMWTILGLVFFYLVLVFISSKSRNVTLNRLQYNGWPRFASRATAAVTSAVFSIHLLTPSSSLWSLFTAVMVACAHFCHIVVLGSDLVVFSDQVIVKKMFREEITHPIFKTLPLYTSHYVGMLGYACLAVVVLERTYGGALKERRRSIPLLAGVCCFVVWCVFNLFFIDRLVAAVTQEKGMVEIAYPAAFVAFLGISGITKFLREFRDGVSHNGAVSEDKKTN